MTDNSKPTHPVAEILWLAWLGNAIVAILTGWPTEGVPPDAAQTRLTAVVLGSFFVLEWFGWMAGRNRPWGATLSEVVWYRIPIWQLRWALGTFLAIGAMVLVSKFAGIVLLCWLGAHFAYRAGVDARDELEREARNRATGGSGGRNRLEE